MSLPPSIIAMIDQFAAEAKAKFGDKPVAATPHDMVLTVAAVIAALGEGAREMAQEHPDVRLSFADVATMIEGHAQIWLKVAEELKD